MIRSLRFTMPTPNVFAALIMLTTACVALSQEPRATIRVEVKTKDAPVAGAAVTINGAVLQTDENGLAVGSAPLGRAKITVKKESFLPATTSITLDQAREWQIAVELRSQEPREEQMTVYATRTGARLQDLPTRVEVLGQEEIEEKTLMTPGDIVMMLNEMGGLRVQTTSPSLGAASIRMQGMRGRYTRVLSDGLPLFGQQGAGLGLLQIPPMDLGQVEVIKGVASALYGAGAMAGVVNLIARRPGTEPVHELLVNRSTLGATDASLFLASALPSQWSVSFLGGGHFQERNDVNGDGWADLANYERGVARPRFFWDDGEGRTALLTAGVTYEDRVGGTMPGAVLPATGRPYEEALKTRRYDAGGNVQFLIQSRYVVTARFAGSSQKHDHRFGEVRERDSHDMLFGEVTLRGTSGRQTWVAGVAAEREAYRPLDVPRFTYTYAVPGVFLQDDIELARWISVSASGRADFHNRYGTFLSPRLAALFRWRGWTSRVSVGQGFFAPTPLTEETEAAGLSRLVVQSPLVAERGRSASFDLTRVLGPVSLTTTLFASTVRHPVYVVRSTRYEITNLPESSTNRGLEFLGTWRKAPLSVTASYTYVRSRQLDLDLGRRADVPLTPRHTFGLVGMREAKEKWRFGAECYYTGQQRLEQNPYRSESKPYVLFGLLGERRLGRVRLFLNAENLTNVRQTRWDALLRPTRSVDGRWTVDAWAPLDGRVINGGIRLGF